MSLTTRVLIGLVAGFVLGLALAGSTAPAVATLLAMLPVILCSVRFGAALAGGAAERRDAVLRVTQGIADAMQRLVAGILELAPIGVFALAVPLASKLGLAAAGAVIAYIVLVVLLTVLVAVVLLYPVRLVGGSMSRRAFRAFCAPAAAVACAS